ncbi:MAG: hypothetical protein HC886_11655 [Leptolyngbyaceae cyanobacterium SM1_1_3]|nr:hypothetical protein [Leptolyngbyaceae cyanobacterium SM1_1_3]
MALYQPIVAYAQKARSPQLKAWIKTLGSDPAMIQYGLKKCLLSQCLYGTDRSEIAVEIARLQLLLSLIASAPSASIIEPLPHLEFNLLAGEALVGLVSVDEAGFDETPPLSSLRRRRSPVVLQGNLLQPLAAETYRTILAEKNISLEHYRSQSELMAEGSIPDYVRVESLRDRIDELNQQAQAKLDQLLLNDFSQKHGIRYRVMQGNRQKRLLDKADIASLAPIHWGFQFQQILTKQGGFAIILTRPPWGAVGPTAVGFCQEYGALLASENITLREFLRQKKECLKNSAIATAWQKYESRFTYVNEYLRLSQQYAYQNAGKSFRKRLRLELLYLERCFDLLRSGGFCTLLLPAHTPDNPDAQPVLKALQQQTQLDSVVIYTNNPAWFVGLKPNFQFCLLTFQKLSSPDRNLEPG